MILAELDDVRFWPGIAARPALDGVSLRVRAGEIVLVEGPSGSGKSTLLRVIAGLVPHFHGGRFAGSARVCGHDTRFTPAAEIARHVGCVFQDPETQAVRASVAADVAFGPENLGVAPDVIRDAVAAALARTGTTALADRAIAELSGGERQRVAIAAVLACGPRVVLLDEPTSQLDPQGVAALDRIVRALAAEGAGVVVTEHHAHRLAVHADRVITLERGRIVAGTPVLPPAPPPAPDPGDEVLRVQDVVAEFDGRVAVDGCSLGLRARTVTALRGANGSGKSTLLRVIAGLHEARDGRVALDGRDVTRLPTEERVPTIGFLPQDGGRRLICERVRDEVGGALGRLGRLERDRRLANALTDLDLVDLADTHPLDLSVGERERVALAAVLAAEPRVILLDEPTRGMDAAHRAALVGVLRDRARGGACILLATHDPHFAEAVADVHLTMSAGQLTDGEADANLLAAEGAGR